MNRYRLLGFKGFRGIFCIGHLCVNRRKRKCLKSNQGGKKTWGVWNMILVDTYWLAERNAVSIIRVRETERPCLARGLADLKLKTKKF